MPATANPAEYYDKPLETWSVLDLTDAMGTKRAAEVLQCSATSVRMLRWRSRSGRGSKLSRVQALLDEIRTNEDHYRRTLVTVRNGSRPNE